MDATVVAVAILAWLSLLWVFFGKSDDDESDTDRLAKTIRFIHNEDQDHVLERLERHVRTQRLLILHERNRRRLIE